MGEGWPGHPSSEAVCLTSEDPAYARWLANLPAGERHRLVLARSSEASRLENPYKVRLARERLLRWGVTKDRRAQAAEANGRDPATVERCLQVLMGGATNKARGLEAREYFKTIRDKIGLGTEERRALWRNRAVLGGTLSPQDFDAIYVQGGVDELWAWLFSIETQIVGCVGQALRKGDQSPLHATPLCERWRALGTLTGSSRVAELSVDLSRPAPARVSDSLCSVGAALLVAELCGLPPSLVHEMRTAFDAHRQDHMDWTAATANSKIAGEAWVNAVGEVVADVREGIVPGSDLLERKRRGAAGNERKREMGWDDPPADLEDVPPAVETHGWPLSPEERSRLRAEFDLQLSTLAVLGARNPQRVLPPRVFKKPPPIGSILAAARQYLLFDEEVRAAIRENPEHVGHRDWPTALRSCLPDADPSRWEAVSARQSDMSAVAYVVWFVAKDCSSDVSIMARRVSVTLAAGAAAMVLSELASILGRVVGGGSVGPVPVGRAIGMVDTLDEIWTWFQEPTDPELGLPPGHTSLDILSSLVRDGYVTGLEASIAGLLHQVDRLLGRCSEEMVQVLQPSAQALQAMHAEVAERVGS